MISCATFPHTHICSDINSGVLFDFSSYLAYVINAMTLFLKVLTTEGSGVKKW